MKISIAHRIEKIIEILSEATKQFTPPMSVLIKKDYNNDPYVLLIACLLSLRARDAQTYEVVKVLFSKVKTPYDMVKMDQKELEQIIYPIGFYKRKAEILKSVSHELITRFAGKVPRTEEELLSIKGVGRKTANLVLGEGFGIPAICVDVHVHRISNRLGIVTTQTPAQTEQALKKLVPEKQWVELNRYLVMWGQNICVPLSPWCSRCAIIDYCDQKGVIRKR